jgi:prevent-host-death family protein
MKTTGIADLKTHLSRYLDRVKSGQEVLITERGRPVAKLVPLSRSEQRESRRERLVRLGLLQAGQGPVPRALLRPPRGRVGAGVLEALLSEREHGR